MSCGNLRDRNIVFFPRLAVLYGEGYRAVVFSWMGRLVAWAGIYRFEVLAQEVSEICNCVLCVAYKLNLGLRALEFFAIDVGEDARDLAVAFFVRYDFGFAFLYYR